MTAESWKALPATVTILRRSTGEMRTLRMEHAWKQNDGSCYWWSDGNFGCDCNRSDLFHGADAPEDPECNGFNRNEYVVLAITLDSGEVVYTETP